MYSPTEQYTSFHLDKVVFLSQMWMFGQMPCICQTGSLSQITCQCLISDWLSDSWWTSYVL